MFKILIEVCADDEDILQSLLDKISEKIKGGATYVETNHPQSSKCTAKARKVELSDMPRMQETGIGFDDQER